MSDLVQNCNIIASDSIPESCGSDNLSFPRLFVIWAANTVISAAGATPTAAEVQTLLSAALGCTSGRFSNGVKIPAETTVLSGADTIDGLDDVVKEVEGISGNLRTMDNTVLQMWAQNNLNNQRAQLGWVDDNGRWHGGVTGYSIPFYTPAWEHAGEGSSAAIPFIFKWKRNPLKYVPYSDVDLGYLDLTNLAS